MPTTPAATSMAANRAPRGLSADVLADRIAGRQHGIVTLSQLREVGLSRQMVWSRVRNGRFAPLHRGVYRVGPPLSEYAERMAAALACGPQAVLSHRSAAMLWGLLSPTEVAAGKASAPCEVSVPRSARGSAPAGIRVHRVTSMPDEDATRRHGIPVTAPLRTLIDLASLAARRRRMPERDPLPPVGARELERAVATAERESLVRLDELRNRIAAHPGRAGCVPLRRVLDMDGGPAFTRSEAEAVLLELIRKARLPPPQVNVEAAGYELDFLWREAGLVVEVDGFAFHGSRDRFEADRVRDAELAARGLRVVRVTWRQIRDTPLKVVVRLAQALLQGEPRGAARIGHRTGVPTDADAGPSRTR